MKRTILTLAMAAAIPCPVAAEVAPSPSPSPSRDEASGIAFFESKVRPVLVERCYDCHSADAGFAEGGLQLDTRAAIRAGGKRGPAVVPGNPGASLLLKAIAHADPDLRMPPKEEKLPDAVIADLERWIRSGAPDPRAEGPAAPSSAWDGYATAREHWSYRPKVWHDAPPIGDEGWPRREIDAFILAKLEANGLSPAPDAEPETLLRRLHFDLVGLPPSPAVIAEFLHSVEAEGLDRALEAEVDRLLATPGFGERWGRHWLDVARYAESSGKEANISFPYAFRYRGYVIDSVNADVPFDRFLTEQVAGDLLPADEDAERARLLIATGFLALGPKNLEEMSDPQFAADVADEQIDTVTRAAIGSTVACARCHDHKFDPFRMDDYYALAGIFRSTRTFFGTAVSPANRRGGDPLPLPRLDDLPVFHASIPAKKVEELKAEMAALRLEEKQKREAQWKAILSGKDAEGIFTLGDALRIFWKTGAIEGQLEKVDESGKALALAMGVLDRDAIEDAPLLQRGEVGRPGDRVPRGFPRVIDLGDSIAIPPDRSGRLELARWLTDPDHPLTTRVFVNRAWHHLFGAGLVRTVDNFGTTGEPPSHPELLDRLALRFERDGWSLKALVREVVLSRAYRQSSSYDESSFRVDPEDRLLWRASKRRLEAEAIRDAMLAASGELDPNRPAGSLVARAIGDRPIALIGLDKQLPVDLDGSTHRSVYLPAIRDRLPDVLDQFNAADPSFVTGERETTNVPLQALYLMNGPFVQARSAALAARLTREADGDEARVRLAFRLCFGREPDDAEAARSLDFLADDPNEGDGPSALESFCQAILSTAEFRNLD